MTHCQIFYPFDNEDGYISVVCHRERFLESLLSLGWQKTAAEAIAVRDELTKEKIGEPAELMHQGPEIVDGCDDAASGDGLSAKQRKKLSLKK